MENQPQKKTKNGRNIILRKVSVSTAVISITYEKHVSQRIREAKKALGIVVGSTKNLTAEDRMKAIQAEWALQTI